MVPPAGRRCFFRPAMRGMTVRIGCFSILIQVPARESELIDQIVELYGGYPQGSLDEVPDFQIALRSRTTLFLRRRLQADLSGHVRYPAAPLGLGLPMLESGLNWLVWTSLARFLLLHAAVLEHRGSAIILPGPSGVGKSTLCAALAARGWRLLSDEVAMVRPQDGRLQPYPRPISLKNESIGMIARRVPAARFSRRFDDTAKGTVAFMRAPPEAIARAGIPAAPRLVVFPRYAGGAPLELAPLEKAETFMRLIGHSSNYLTLLETGFETLATLVESCEHYALSYGALDDAVSAIEDLAPATRERAPVAR
jgi:HprK-related kinase A